VAELVDAHGSGPCAARCGGSSPSVGTIYWQYSAIGCNRNIVIRSAHVAELVDAHGSGPCAARCGGSSPSVGTNSFLVDADRRKTPQSLKKDCGVLRSCVHDKLLDCIVEGAMLGLR
jgi:hypothetical protein